MLKIGDVVSLKSGGPLMTVVADFDVPHGLSVESKGYWNCGYFDSNYNHMNTIWAHQDALDVKKIEAAE